MPETSEFLTPEAMLTPGGAGALTMMITNGLTSAFDLHRAGTGLALSFTFGLLVFIAVRPWWQRITYYVLNSLIIFCVALGANTVGTTKLGDLGLSTAYAESATQPGSASGAIEMALSTKEPSFAAAERARLETQVAELRAKMKELKQAGAKDEAKKLERDLVQVTLLLEYLESSKILSLNQKREFFEPWLLR